MNDTRPIAPQSASPHSVGNRIARMVWSVVYTLLFRPSPRFVHGWRRFLLWMFGAKLLPGVRVYPRARIWAPWNLIMSSSACIADDVDVYNVATITIGSCSTVSQYGYLCTASHDFEDVHHPLTSAPIVIGEHCWLAADVFVAPGVTIADGTVVGARSSVFEDLPAWSVATGTPAKVVRPRKLTAADFRQS
jgi:putative colanic acid biosynthesis acetyltransferase WcaF